MRNSLNHKTRTKFQEILFQPNNVLQGCHNMKNILFTLIMSTSTALFALPSDSSMGENFEAKSIHRHRSGNSDSRRGPTGPTGPAGSSVVLSYGNFTTSSDSSATINTPIQFDQDGLHSADIQRVGITSSTAASAYNGVAIAIQKPGTYVVTFGAQATSATVSGGLELFRNGSPVGEANTKLNLQQGAGLTSLTTRITISAADVAAGLNGAALLQVLVNDTFTLIGDNNGVSAFIDVQRVGE